MNKIFNFIKERQYIIYFAISLGIIDVYLRYINRTMKSFSVLDLIPNTFTIVWILIFSLIIYNIKNKKIKGVITIIINIVFVILSFTNIIFSRLFSKFFSFKDILYAGEGLEFISSITEYIKFMDLIIIIISIAFAFFSIYSYRYIKKEKMKLKLVTSIIFAIFIISGIILAQCKIGKEIDPTHWSAFSNKRNIYNQFNDTKRSLMLCGLYEYSIRDFYLTFLKNTEIDKESYCKEISEYIASNDKNVSNYNGILKDKNLILIMLENIDTWMINEKSMPTLYKLQQKSINFTEHYSENYANGKTFNTEFITNTGIIPNVKALRAAYSYNENNYDYSLANLFKNSGYITNSIHKNKGDFYNRDNMHIAWGYSEHYDSIKLNSNGENMNLDTTVVKNNLDKFIYEDKFMTFFITYSAHLPYEYKKEEAQKNIEYIKEQFDSEDEAYLCALSQAKVTDDAIKILVEELEKQGKMEDTVLIFFTDHYSYSMDQEMISKLKNETDKNLLTKTPFFIYNNGNYIETVEKVNSTVDILPTIADLFGLKYNPNIYSGFSIFDDNYKGVVVFHDRTWYDGEIYYKYDQTYQDNDYITKMNEYVEEVLTVGGKIVESDYFREFKINE